jgi:hypothetical protein
MREFARSHPAVVLLTVLLILSVTITAGNAAKIWRFDGITITSGTTAANAVNWGADCNLYRTAANAIKTDDALTVALTTTLTGNTTVGGTLGVTGASTLTGALTANGAVTLGDAVGDTITVNGTPTFVEAVACSKTLTVTGNQTNTADLTVNGNTALGNAATDTITCTGRLILRTLGSDPLDGTPANRPAGSVGEIGYYSSGVYLCTDAATPTWVKVGPAA